MLAMTEGPIALPAALARLVASRRASWRGATYGTLGKCVTWPRVASAMSMPAWSSSSPVARSSSMRDFSYAALAETRFDSPVVSVAASCRIVDLRGESDFQLLLIGVQRLARQVDGGLRGLHGGAVLLHIKLRVAHFDSHLILQLVLAHLRLAIFEFRAHLVRLRQAIANRNVQCRARRLCRERSNSRADSKCRRSSPNCIVRKGGGRSPD